MTLPAPVRSAVLEVVQRLRDPMLDVHVDSVAWMIRQETPSHADATRAVIEVRAALGLDASRLAALADWARGKSREEVAEALEKIATSGTEPR